MGRQAKKVGRGERKEWEGEERQRTTGGYRRMKTTQGGKGKALTGDVIQKYR